MKKSFWICYEKDKSSKKISNLTDLIYNVLIFKFRISEEDFYKCLKEVQLPKSKNRFFEEKIVTLQRKLEDLLGDDHELRVKASKGKR